MKNYLREQGKKRKKYKGHKNIQIFATTRMGKGKKLTYKEKKKLGIRIRLDKDLLTLFNEILILSFS